MEGSPKFAASQSLPDVDYAAFARSLGLHGDEHRHARRDRAAPGSGRCAADRPTVLDVHCDPDVPPIPPHATFEQAKSAGQSGARRRRGRRGRSSSRESNRRCSSTCPGEGTERDRERSPTVGARRALRDVRTGRFERTLAALTAAGAAVTAAEIYLSHDGASFGNKMMWWPIVVVPTAIPAGRRGCSRRRAAKTVLPVSSAAGRANGAAGHLSCTGAGSGSGRAASPTIQHGDRARRCSRPLLASLVGGMGLLAALLRREAPLPGDGNGD